MIQRSITETQYKLILRNQQGIPGPRGDKGDTGQIGPAGEQGPQGIPGPTAQITASVVESALGFVPINNALMGVPNGVALLDSDGNIISRQDSSTVDGGFF